MRHDEALVALEKEKKLERWLQVKGPKLLRIMRRRAKMGVNEYADFVGVSPAYISRCERGHMPLGRPLAEKLLREYFTRLNGGVKDGD